MTLEEIEKLFHDVYLLERAGIDVDSVRPSLRINDWAEARVLVDGLAIEAVNDAVTGEVRKNRNV